MRSFFYYTLGKETGWQLALSEHREKTIASAQPKYITVLDLDTKVEDDFSAENYAKVPAPALAGLQHKKSWPQSYAANFFSILRQLSS